MASAATAPTGAISFLVFAQRFQAVAWDARGYGESDDYDGPLSYDDFCDDLVRVLDHFKSDKAHLVGLSWATSSPRISTATIRSASPSLVLADAARVGAGIRSAAREEFLRLRLKPLQEGKSVAEMAPAVARSLMGSSAGRRFRTPGREHVGAARST